MLLCSRDRLAAVIYYLRTAEGVRSASQCNTPPSPPRLVSGPLGRRATADVRQGGRGAGDSPSLMVQRFITVVGCLLRSACPGTSEWLCRCFAQLSVLVVARARPLFDMRSESAGGGNERTIKVLLSQPQLLFFDFYRFPAICCLTSCSGRGTELVSRRELSLSRRAGGLEVRNRPPVQEVRARPGTALQRVTE